MENLNDLTLSELVKMYDIVLHNRGVALDEFVVADFIRSNIIDRLMEPAMVYKAKPENN